MHESSFIPPYDAYFKNTLAPPYEKADRHQGGLRGGERRQPADPRHHRGGERQRPRHDRDRLQLGLPVRRQVRRRERHRRRDRQGKRRLVRIGAGSGGGQRQVEGDPVRQYRPADELAHRLVQGGRLRQVPRHLGRAPGGRHQAQEGGPPVRLRAGPRLRRQSRLALSAAVVLRRPRGRGRRQDHRDRFRRDRAGDRLLPQVLQGDHARGLPGLDRRQQQQGVPVGADLLHQQRRIDPVVGQEGLPRHGQGDRPVGKSRRDRRVASTC